MRQHALRILFAMALGAAAHVGRLQVDKKTKPSGMGLLHDTGLRWNAIYEVDGEDFKINYVDAGGSDKVPTAFRTSADTEATLVILKRAKK